MKGSTLSMAGKAEGEASVCSHPTKQSTAFTHAIKGIALYRGTTHTHTHTQYSRLAWSSPSDREKKECSV